MPGQKGGEWRKLMPSTSAAKLSFLLLLLSLLLLFVFVVDIGSIDGLTYFQSLSSNSLFTFTNSAPQQDVAESEPEPYKEYPIICGPKNGTQTCPNNYPTKHKPRTIKPDRPSTCPSYFRWIHEDLRPWKQSGITKETVERANRTANFRLAIVDGRVYVKQYFRSYQTRDVFTIWSIVQLVRKYPGRLPDLELMFDCEDTPAVTAGEDSSPAVLFGYCNDDKHVDLIFPDWAYWGWSEINVRQWEGLNEEIKEGRKKAKWEDRVPLAYWKGNPFVGKYCKPRRELLTCNRTDQADWNALIYIQNWGRERSQGYRNSNLANQCHTHRYKIYVEGLAWSVSEKYILACDSVPLIITPRYHDFFTRQLLPLEHYWPIRDSDKCRSIKFAVEWGNNHTSQAKNIGRSSSKFMDEEVKMEYVYDYMFHLLNEYGKLFKYKPTIPEGATEVCSESLACQYDGMWRKNMEESHVRSPSPTPPCSLPSPFEPAELKEFLDKKASLLRQVETWEDEYWKASKA